MSTDYEDYDAHDDDRAQAAAAARHLARCEADDALPKEEKKRLIAADVAEQRARRNADEAARLRANAEAQRDEDERRKREHARWRGDR